MYSQSSISSHRSSRSAPTEEALHGLTCVICGTDYRTAPAAETVAVSHGGEASVLACRGVCARMAGGPVTGPDATVPPLAERVRRYEAARAAQQADQAQRDQTQGDQAQGDQAQGERPGQEA
ncbi:hypothetical protein [Streptomyces sp. NPDC058657]|uniref:hypothetical protein n=1 Tax=unclassified Streptomyces TaxID=2593676 RepID=UPI003665E020